MRLAGGSPNGSGCGCSSPPAGSRSPAGAVLHFSRAGRWTGLLLRMVTTLRALPAPAD